MMTNRQQMSSFGNNLSMSHASNTSSQMAFADPNQTHFGMSTGFMGNPTLKPIIMRGINDNSTFGP